MGRRERAIGALLTAVAGFALVGAGSQSKAPVGLGTPPPEVAANAATGWPAHNYNLANTRDDTHTAIDAANVGTLRPKWTFKLTDHYEFGYYTTNAIVVAGVVYFESPLANVYALNATTGHLLWEHKYDTPIPSSGPTGLAVGYGMLFGSTATSAFALNPQNGKQIWIRRLARNIHEGIDSTPTVYDHTVLISTIPGSATSYYDGGAWGTVYALKATTGATLWSFSTVKGGSGLWGDPALNGGGGLWYPAAVDSEGRIFAGTGNPSPVYSTAADPNARSRPGPDLYTDSLLALDGSTGRLLWYHQATPHDVRDYDFQDPPILATLPVDGKPTEVVLGAGKSGKVLGFRARDGKVLWTLNIGRHNALEYGPLPKKPALVCPGSLGGVLTPMAYSAGVVFVPWIDLCVTLGVDLDTSPNPPHSPPLGGLAAVDAATGRVVWSHPLPYIDSGAATVANDVVFTSTLTGEIYAISTKTGRLLWSTEAPGAINGFPALTKTMLIIGTGATTARKHVTNELIAYSLGGH